MMRILLRAAAPALALLATACATPQVSRAPVAPVEVGIIAINDFHGALEPPMQALNLTRPDGSVLGVPAGGAAWLASAVDSLKAAHPNNVVVAAGDLTSASQLASSLYLDEPAVGVLNRLGLEFNAVGNHEFDRGWQELMRLQNGGCEKLASRDPCQIEKFSGARYKYLAASTFREDGSTLFPATGVKTFGEGARQVTIGFVGLSLKGVPDLVGADGIRGLTFGDEAEAINTAVPKLKAQGADAVVVLIHQGGRTKGSPDPSGCTDFYGDIEPILAKLDPRVDVVVSGHTHWAYVCNYGDKDPARPILLTSAAVYGEAVTDITLTIDPAADRVIAKTARNVIVQSEPYQATRGLIAKTDVVPRFAPRADVAAYIKPYVEGAKIFTDRVVGRISRSAEKTTGELSNTGGPLGNLIADGQLAATRAAGAQIAVTNPFGIRASLVPATDGSVNFGQIYAVQPFNNELVTLTLTGAQVISAFEDGLAFVAKQVLAPSRGVRLVYDMSRPARSRVVSLTLDGKPIDPAATYKVTMAKFLADGGDGFETFARARERRTTGLDIDAFEAWIAAAPVREVPQEERTIRQGG